MKLELGQLKEQLASSQQMAQESARREKGRSDGLFETLRGEYDRSKSDLEERCV